MHDVHIDLANLFASTAPRGAARLAAPSHSRPDSTEAVHSVQKTTYPWKTKELRVIKRHYACFEKRPTVDEFNVSLWFHGMISPWTEVKMFLAGKMMGICYFFFYLSILGCFSKETKSLSRMFSACVITSLTQANILKHLTDQFVTFLCLLCAAWLGNCTFLTAAAPSKK